MSRAFRIRDFLAGTGRDGSGRLLADILAFDDAAIEGVHDFIQWCFPLRRPSAAVPGSPVLSDGEAETIRADERALAGLAAAARRMRAFYADTDAWLRAHDHNHLRISRILTCLRDLAGPQAAETFHAFVTARDAQAGGPVNRDSLAFWARAATGE